MNRDLEPLDPELESLIVSERAFPEVSAEARERLWAGMSTGLAVGSVTAKAAATSTSPPALGTSWAATHLGAATGTAKLVVVATLAFGLGGAAGVAWHAAQREEAPRGGALVPTASPRTTPAPRDGVGALRTGSATPNSPQNMGGYDTLRAAPANAAALPAPAAHSRAAPSVDRVPPKLSARTVAVARAPVVQAPVLPSRAALGGATPEPARGMAEPQHQEVATTPPGAAPARESADPGSLVPAGERDLIALARRALAHGQTTLAFDAITRHAELYPDGRLVEEREAVRVLAWARTGRVDATQAAAALFRDHYPRSRFAGEIDAAMARLVPF